MARPVKKATTTIRKPKSIEEESKIISVEEEIVVKKEEKKFDDEDGILCISLTPGQLFVKGERSKDLYTFGDLDDVVYIRYDDLVYMVRTKSEHIFNPRFIIQDADFLNKFPEVEKAYGEMFSTQDLKDVITKTPVSQIANRLKALPIGAQDALKILVMTMVDNGTFDSVQKLKVFDEFFGTKMLIKLTGN